MRAFSTTGAPYQITGSAILDARFPGQWFQLEAGLHYNWHRSYDASLGRYTQPDPLGFVDGPSVYGYARSSPSRFVDRDGRAVPAVCIIAPAACAAAGIRIVTEVIKLACAVVVVETVIVLTTDNGAPPNEIPIPPGAVQEGVTGTGIEIFGKPGDFDTAKEDFADYKPTGVVNRPKDVTTGTGSDGSTIIVRPTSDDGRPTLEIQGPTGRDRKIRYSRP